MLIGTPALYAYTGGVAYDPVRPTIVFIHGAQHDHSVWILQSRYLAHHGFGVLALDLPGHLRSAGPALESVEAIAETVAAALRTTTAAPLLLAGHSMGSLIALELAARLRPQVAGVALLGTAFPMQVSEALLAATRDMPAAAMHMINVWSHSSGIGAFTTKPSAPGPGYSVFWQNLRLMERIAAVSGPEVLVRDFAACNAYQGGLDAARTLSCPALFVLGARDAMTTPRAARALVEATPQAEVLTVPDCGHSLMTERPDAVLDALRGFAARVFG